MTIFDLPDNRWRSANWTPAYPEQQINKSEFTGGEQVLELVGKGRATCDLVHVPIVGANNIPPIRAILAKMKGHQNALRIPATEAAQTSSPDPSITGTGITQTLTNIINTTVTANSIVEKTSGTPGTFDAAAQSGASTTADALVTFRGNGQAARFIAGWSLTPNSDNSENGILYGIDRFHTGEVRVRNGASDLGSFGVWPLDAAMGVLKRGTGMFYIVDGTVVYSQTVAASQDLLFDCTIPDIGTRIEGISMSLDEPDFAGQTTLRLVGLAPSTTLPAGSLMTVGEQLVTLTEPLIANSSGVSTATFEPLLRQNVNPSSAARLKLPYCVMKMVQPYPSIGVDPGQQYGFSIKLEEA